MTIITILSATIAACIASTLMYLGSPGQKLLPQPVRPRTSILGGCALFMLSLVLLWQVMGPASAVFGLTILVMLAWTILPFPLALLAKRKEHAE